MQTSHFKNWYGVALLLSFVLVLASWFYGFAYGPPDAQQGMVYKIIFVHVPVAACALGWCSLGLLVASAGALIKNDERFLWASQAWAETGLLFTLLTLLTGSIWGKPTWGTWWTWDARLTTTLLLAILLAAWLLLKQSLPRGRQQIRVCGVLGIIIFADVPIIYKSVEWWRTLHQPASLIAERGRTMDPEMLNILLLAIATLSVFCFFLWLVRYQNIKLTSQIETEALSAR